MTASYHRDGRCIIAVNEGKVESAIILPSVAQAKRYNRVKLGGKAQTGGSRPAIPADLAVEQVNFPRTGDRA